MGSAAVGSIGSASIGSAAVGSLGSAAVGSSDHAPGVPSADDVRDASAPDAPVCEPGDEPAGDAKASEKTAEKSPVQKPPAEDEVIRVDGGLPVTGVNAGILAGIAGALMVLGGLLIGRRARA